MDSNPGDKKSEPPEESVHGKRLSNERTKPLPSKEEYDTPTSVRIFSVTFA